MLKAIIVDDEHANRQLLNDLLKTHCPTVNIVGKAGCVDSAYEEINDKKPNLVFLDIQMPTGNGFKLLEKFEHIYFDIIFVTSFDQYAINAIKFSALDYLLKPIDPEELKIAVKKAITKAEKDKNFQLLYQNLLNNIQPTITDKKMAIRANNNTILIKMSDIKYIEADSNYSFIYLISGIKYHTAKTLKEFEELTADMPVFIRISKSTIINSAHCSHYIIGDPSRVVLKSGDDFEISRRKKNEVIDKLKTVIT